MCQIYKIFLLGKDNLHAFNLSFFFFIIKHLVNVRLSAQLICIAFVCVRGRD